MNGTQWLGDSGVPASTLFDTLIFGAVAAGLFLIHMCFGKADEDEARGPGGAGGEVVRLELRQAADAWGFEFTPGLVVKRVAAFSPAEKCGLARCVGRRLTEVDRVPVSTVGDVELARAEKLQERQRGAGGGGDVVLALRFEAASGVSLSDLFVDPPQADAAGGSPASSSDGEGSTYPVKGVAFGVAKEPDSASSRSSSQAAVELDALRDELNRARDEAARASAACARLLEDKSTLSRELAELRRAAAAEPEEEEHATRRSDGPVSPQCGSEKADEGRLAAEQAARAELQEAHDALLREVEQCKDEMVIARHALVSEQTARVDLQQAHDALACELEQRRGEALAEKTERDLMAREVERSKDEMVLARHALAAEQTARVDLQQAFDALACEVEQRRGEALAEKTSRDRMAHTIERSKDEMVLARHALAAEQTARADLQQAHDALASEVEQRKDDASPSLEALQAALAEAEEELRALKAGNGGNRGGDEADDKLAAEHTAHEMTKRDLEVLQAALAEAEEELCALKAGNGEKRGGDEADDKWAVEQIAHEMTRRELEVLRAVLAETEGDLRALKEQGGAEGHTAEAAEGELQSLRRQLAKTEDELHAVRLQLADADVSLATDIGSDALKAELSEANACIADLRAQLSSAGDAADQLRLKSLAMERLESELDVYRTVSLAGAAGAEDVGRIVRAKNEAIDALKAESAALAGENGLLLRKLEETNRALEAATAELAARGAGRTNRSLGFESNDDDEAEAEGELRLQNRRLLEKNGDLEDQLSAALGSKEPPVSPGQGKDRQEQQQQQQHDDADELRERLMDKEDFIADLLKAVEPEAGGILGGSDGRETELVLVLRRKLAEHAAMADALQRRAGEAGQRADLENAWSLKCLELEVDNEKLRLASQKAGVDAAAKERQLAQAAEALSREREAAAKERQQKYVEAEVAREQALTAFRHERAELEVQLKELRLQLHDATPGDGGVQQHELAHLRNALVTGRQQLTVEQQKVNELTRERDQLKDNSRRLEREMRAMSVLEQRCIDLERKLQERSAGGMRASEQTPDSRLNVHRKVTPPAAPSSQYYSPDSTAFGGSPSRVAASTPDSFAFDGHRPVSQVELLRMNHGLCGRAGDMNAHVPQQPPPPPPQVHQPRSAASSASSYQRVSSPQAAAAPREPLGVSRVLGVFSEEKPAVQGTYELMDGVVHNGHPMWACGNHRIFSSKEGYWMVSADGAGPAKNVGRLVSSTVHEGRTPELVGSWDYSNGAEWVTSKNTRVALPFSRRSASPGDRSPSSSASSPHLSLNPANVKPRVPACVPRLPLPSREDLRAADYGFPQGWQVYEDGRAASDEGVVFGSIPEAAAHLQQLRAREHLLSAQQQQQQQDPSVDVYSQYGSPRVSKQPYAVLGAYPQHQQQQIPQAYDASPAAKLPYTVPGAYPQQQQQQQQQSHAAAQAYDALPAAKLPYTVPGAYPQQQQQSHAAAQSYEASPAAKQPYTVPGAYPQQPHTAAQPYEASPAAKLPYSVPGAYLQQQPPHAAAQPYEASPAAVKQPYSVPGAYPQQQQQSHAAAQPYEASLAAKQPSAAPGPPPREPSPPANQAHGGRGLSPQQPETRDPSPLAKQTQQPQPQAWHGEAAECEQAQPKNRSPSPCGGSPQRRASSPVRHLTPPGIENHASGSSAASTLFSLF
ncbi:hypothetical protein DIPPA_11440 [Diplonema papillatum]|nr:hypothetical protein DIPPA_11440 [Diplonema papillatum]